MRYQRPKTSHTRASNNAEVDRYSGHLERLFKDWLGSGRPLLTLTDDLDQAAQAEFPIAFERGKRQALPTPLHSGDRQAIALLIASNAHYVRWSLETAIQQRKQIAEITGEDVSKVLDSAFASRVRLQYGGRLWQVMEAGYQAGVRELAARVRLRMRQVPLGMAVDDGDDPDAEDDSDVSDAVLAAALGLTLSAFLGLIGSRSGQTVTTVTIQIGTQYITEQDDAVCEPCQANGDGGDGDGVYWLPDDPPLPGEDCLGNQSCRCWLESVSEIN